MKSIDKTKKEWRIYGKVGDKFCVRNSYEGD